MSLLSDCPHCSTRVLPMPGRICPSCRKGLDAPPDPKVEAEQTLGAAQAYASEQLGHGADPGSVRRRLAGGGLDPDLAARVVGDTERGRARASREAGQKDMAIGAVIGFIGVAVTTLTYQSAANSGGGRVLVAWGAIFFGAIRFLRGVYRSA